MRDTMSGWMLVTAMLFSAAASAEEAKSYEIVLDRHVEVGSKFRAVSRGTNAEELVVTVEGVVVDEKKSEVAVDLDASAEILEVDERGRTKTAKLVIERFSSESDGKRVDALARGTEVVLAIDGKTEQYTIDGKPVPEALAKLLKLVNALPTTDASDDEVFGSKERRRVGDSWPIDAARAAEWFSEPGMTIEKKGVSGETKLTGAANVDGDEAITVEARVTMEEIAMAMPEGFRLVEGRLDARFTGRFPVDVKRAKLEESLTGSSALTAVGTAGQSGGSVVTLKATGTRTRTTKFIAR